jgi:acyl-CoA thioester hydrolase
MFLHVDLSIRRVAPFPPDLRDRLADAAATHAAAGRPDWVGRRIAMPS